MRPFSSSRKHGRFDFARLFTRRDGNKSTAIRRRKQQRQSHIQSLEERALLAVFSVSAGVSDGAVGSLRYAVNQANSNSENDTINLAAGTYVLGAGEDIDVTESGKTITFNGADVDTTIIDANGGDRSFEITSGVTAFFNDLTITGGGSNQSGSGVKVYYGDATFDTVKIINNTGYEGGGIYVQGSTSTNASIHLIESLVADNTTARSGGGIYASTADVTIEDSIVDGNTATSIYGGGIYAYKSDTEITGSEITFNTSSSSGYSGGGVGIAQGTLAIADSIISHNQAGRYGGGLNLNALESPATIEGTEISGNVVVDGDGGGIYLRNTELAITESSVDNNEANGGNRGGGIYATTDEDLSIIRSTVSNNSSQYGAGVYFFFTGTTTNLLVENSTFSENAATGYAGGLYYYAQGSGAGSIVNSTFVNNSAPSSGGGIRLQNTVSVLNAKNSIFANNTASSGPDVYGTLTSQGYNLIESTSGATISGTTTGNIYSTDPGLGTLQDNGGDTLTHAPTSSGSPIVDAGTDAGAPSTDQRGINRPQDGDGAGGAVTDIGAVEYNPSVTIEAVADSDSTDEDTVLSVTASGLLGNDSGNGLSISSWNGTSTSGASVTINSNGSFSYDPTGSSTIQALGVGQSLTDTFTYTLNDDQSATDTATVSITVNGVNDAPVAVDDMVGATVLGRYVFYNESTYDSDDEELNASDDFAIAPDKRPLLPGQTATFANYTSYSRGLTGVMVDIEDLTNPGSLSASDFEFRVGNDSSPGSWSTAAAPADIAVRTGDGVNNSYRVSISWDANDIAGEWLQVRVKATANTGLPEDDVFYFGNAVGETGDSAFDANVDDDDETAYSNSLRNPFAIADRFDINRDGSINGTDLQLIDGNEATGSSALQLISAPAVSTPDDYVLYEGNSISIDDPGVLANDYDPDTGDTISATSFTGNSTNGAAVVFYSDGSFSYDSSGSATLNALAAGEVFVDVFAYQVNDSHSANDSGQVFLTVIGVNDAPTATADTDATSEDSSANGNVLTNDSADPDGDTVNVFTFSKTTSKGTFVVASSGAYSYTPSAAMNALAQGESETDVFTYTVTDGKGGTATASITITINGSNDAPLAANDTPSATDESTQVSGIAVLANDTDPDTSDQNSLTVTSFDTSSNLGATVSSSTQDLLDYNPTASSTLNSLAAGESDTDTFSYTISDSQFATDSATVTIVVNGLNDAPTANNDAFNATENNPLMVGAIGVLLNDTDPDTNDNRLVIDADDFSAEGAAITSQTDGAFTYDPGQIFQSLGHLATATDTFTYTIADGNGGSDTATVTITVTGANDAPIAEDDSGYTINYAGELVVAASAGVLLNDDVIDSDDTLSVDTFNSDTSSYYGASIALQADGSFTYDSSTIDVQALSLGTYTDTFTYTLIDSQGLTDTGQVEVVFTLNALTAVDDTSAADEDVVLTTGPNLLANDLPNNNPTVIPATTTSTMGAAVTLSSDGTFSYDPTDAAQIQALAAQATATDTFTYQITDGTSTDTATVTVTVTGANDAPSLSRTLYDLLVVEDAPSTFIDLNRYFGEDAEGTEPSFTVQANDNTSLVTATITNDLLRLSYAAATTGVAELTIRASDGVGANFDAAFKVSVGDEVAQGGGSGEGESASAGDTNGEEGLGNGWQAWDGGGYGGNPDELQSEGLGMGEGEPYITWWPFEIASNGPELQCKCNTNVGGKDAQVSQDEGGAQIDYDTGGLWRNPNDPLPGSGGSGDSGGRDQDQPLPGSGGSVESGWKDPDLPINDFGSPGGFTHRSEDNPRPIIAFDYPLAGAAESLEVELTFAGEVHDPVHYSLPTGAAYFDEFRIALQTVDLNSLSTPLTTGTYAYSVKVTEHYSGGGTTINGFSDSYAIHNRAESEFGNRWWLKELDALDINSVTGDVTWIKGDSTFVRYTEDSGSYESENGSFDTLDYDSQEGRYTITKTNQDQIIFDTQGRLRQRIDRHGNSTTYAYADVYDDGTADQIAYITDAFGRTTTFLYDVSDQGKVYLAGMVDFAGRDTTWEYYGANEYERVKSITSPDPDGTGPLTASVIQYEYNTIGKMTKITDPNGNVTEMTYNFAGQVNGGTNAQGETWSLTPEFSIGLAEIDPTTSAVVGAGTSSNPLAAVASDDAFATYIDVAGKKTETKYDPFGQPTKMTTYVNDGIQIREEVTTWTRDADGRTDLETSPDPDGDGPLGPQTTDYDWGDCCQSLEKITFPDLEEVSWTLDTKYKFPTEFTDEVGRKTLYEIDQATGDTTEVRIVMGNGDDRTISPVETDDLVTTYDYTDATDGLPIGLLKSVTDPEGVSTLYTYYDTPDTYNYGLVESVTYAYGTPDEASIDYEYDSARNVSAVIDELDRRTEFEYDNYDRLIKVMAPDPDGAAPYVPVETIYQYDAKGNLRYITDAETNTTEYQYDEKDRIEKVILPSPDGGASPTTTYTYDDSPSVGSLTVTINETLTATESRNTVMQYDDAGRLVKVSQPTPDGSGSTTVTENIYSEAGTLLKTIDPEGNETSYSYDKRYRVKSVIYPDPDGAGSLAAPEISYTYTASGQLESESDPLGRITSYTYDDAGRVETVTLPDPDGTGGEPSPVISYTYDKVGNVLTTTQSKDSTTSVVTTNVYDARHRLKMVTQPDPDGAGSLTAPVTTFTYDAKGQLVSISDPLMRITSLAYDDLGRLTSVTQPDPDGTGSQTAPVTSYTYDAVGNQLTTTDPLGNVTTNLYDDLYRLTSVTQPDPDGAGSLTAPVTSFTYDLLGRLLTATDPLSRVTSYAYDALDRLTTLTQPDPDGVGSQTSPVTSYTYDLVGNQLTMTDPLGNVTTYGYDDLYRPTTVTQADPDDTGPLSAPVTTYVYDVASQLTSVTDPLSRTTSFDYDDLGRQIEVTQPDPDGAGSQTSPVTSYTYDLVGNRLTMTDSLGKITTYGYDDLYRLTALTQADPDGAGSLTSPVTTYVYDVVSQLESMTDPENRTTSYEYDDLGRRTKLIQADPDGGGSATAPETTYAFDLVGNLTSATDPNSHVTTYGYDNLYRQTSMTNANSETTSFSFDPVGNMLSLTDPETNITEWEYDNLNRMTVETITLDSTEVDRTYAYDAVGNLVEKIDRLGRTTEYIYDHLHQLDQEKWYDTTPTLVNTIDYDYNEIGQLGSVTDGSSSSTYDYLYDDLGRTTQSLFSIDSRTAQFDYEYNAVGNMTAKSATLDSTLDFENAYGYDDLHRLSSFTQTGQMGGNTVADKHVTLAYNDVSQRTALLRYADDYANGANLVIETGYDYDLMGRLTQIDHTDGTSTIHKFDFTYDPASRIQTLTSSVDGLQDYGYDDTNQLTLVEDATPSTLESYTYDDNGNRTMTGYSTGEYNRLTSDGTYDYEYDEEGNRVRRIHISSGATTVYRWDHRNRLTAVIEYADETDADNDQDRLHSVEHQYDAFNQWIAKTVDGDGMGVAVDEFYIHEAGQIIFRLDDSGDIENRYVWDPTTVDQFWADEAIGDELRWSLTDHLGSVRDLVDNVGNIDKHIEYDSFGNVTADSAPGIDLLFGYTSRPFDDDTGLQNNLHRWYEAPLGRWVSEDPIGFIGRDVNIRRYVNNNALNGTDPTGLQILGGPVGEDSPTDKPHIPLGLFPDGHTNNIHPGIDATVLQQMQNGGTAPLPSTVHIPREKPYNTIGGMDPAFLKLLQMKQNWAESTGKPIYSHQSITIPCDGRSSKELADTIYHSLKSFEWFNQGNIANLTVVQNSALGPANVPDRVFGIFRPLQDPNTGSQFNDAYWGTLNAAQLFVNHPTVAVEVFSDDQNQMVQAVTLGNHMVVGVRKWYVQAFDCYVKVNTEAFEARNGEANDLAMRLAGKTAMGLVWKKYLLNIGEVYGGAGGFTYDQDYWQSISAGSQIPFQYGIPGSGAIGPPVEAGYYFDRLGPSQ